MSRNKYPFSSARELNQLITQFFQEVDNSQTETEEVADKSKSASKAVSRELDSPTITGLALRLGFNSLNEFEEREANGKYASILKRARLRIEAAYEKKLHFHSSSGAVFALKSMGWGETADKKAIHESHNNSLKVEIVQSGPKLASAENEVTL
ncbi:MAG: terminase small subunit [Mucilaginibacter sp.]